MRTVSRRIRRFFCAALLPAAGGFALVVPARAQVFGDSGQLVRVQLQNAHRLDGRVARFEHDTLVLSVSDPDGRRLVAIPRSRLTRAWVSVGHSRRTTQGMGIGLLAGAAAGAAIGATSYSPCHSQEFLGCLMAPTSPGQAALLGAGVGGLFGVVIGGVAGVATVRQHWQPVDMPAAVTFAPAERGLGLAVSVPF